MKYDSRFYQHLVYQCYPQDMRNKASRVRFALLRMRKSFGLVQLTIAIGLVSLLSTSAITSTNISAISSHTMLAKSGRLDETLLHALESNHRVRVVVMLSMDDAQVTASTPNTASSVTGASVDVQQQLRVKAMQETVLATLDAADFELIHRYRHVPAISGMVTSVGVGKLLAQPDVANVMLDLLGDGHLDVSGPALGLPAVQSDYGVTGAGVTVAVLDSGIDTDHPDLADAIVAQQCFTSPTPPLWNEGDCLPDYTNTGPSAEDNQGHGTHVSGIIVSNGTVSAKGFAPDANLVSVRVLNRKNAGWVSDWIKGIDWILENFDTQPVQILNMSLGTVSRYTANCDRLVPSMASAIGRLRAKGVTIFASSGNRGDSTGIASPACNSGVISVGATYDSDLGRQPAFNTYLAGFGIDCFDATTSLQTITCFTNSNADLDLLAPGALVESTGLKGGTATFRGTSQASPTAAGVAALLLQAAPLLNTDAIETILKKSGTPVKDVRNGLTFPLINALAAVQMAPYASFSVAIDGPEQGETGVAYPFSVAIQAVSAASPFTYTWYATDRTEPIVTVTQTMTDNVLLKWATPGEKQVTVEVENALGKVSQKHSIKIGGVQIPTAINALQLNGVLGAHIGIVHSLFASVLPLDATLPITYIWETVGQPRLVHVSNESDVGTFFWNEVGTWPLTVTAINKAGAISLTEHIVVSTGEIASVQLDLPTIASAGVPQTYTVQAPADAIVPITYRWKADGQAPIERIGKLSDSMRYSWDEPGQKIITVTASNERSVFTLSQQIEIALLPPLSMTLIAPRERPVGQPMALIANIQPLSVSLPITYEWGATDHAGITHTGTHQDIASFLWYTTGLVTVTVRATNAAGTILDTFAFDINESEVERNLFLPLVMKLEK